MYHKEIKGMNELKSKLLQELNASNLPLEAILFVVRDLYRDVDETYRNYMQQVEQQKKEEPLKEENE